VAIPHALPRIDKVLAGMRGDLVQRSPILKKLRLPLNDEEDAQLLTVLTMD
jgi:hypothetical protein